MDIPREFRLPSSQVKPSLEGHFTSSESPETSWSPGDQRAWRVGPAARAPTAHSPPDDPALQPFSRPLVLNRINSPLPGVEDGVSSIIRGVHEDEIRELAAVIKELGEHAERDTESVAELKAQAAHNARA